MVYVIVSNCIAKIHREILEGCLSSIVVVIQ